MYFVSDFYGLRGALLVTAAIQFNSFAASLLWKIPEKTIEEEVSAENKKDERVTSSHQNMCYASDSLKSAKDENNKDHEKNVNILDVSKLFKEKSNENHDSSSFIAEATNSATNNKLDNNDITFNSCKSSHVKADNNEFKGQTPFADKHTAVHVVTEYANHIEHKETTKPNANKIIDSFRTLLSNWIFVLFAFAATLLNVSVNVFLFLLVDIFRDKGLFTTDSSLALLLMSLFSILGRFSSGALTLIPYVTVLSISCAGSLVLAISHVSVIFIDSPTMILLLSSVFGICMGIARAQVTVTTSQLLDRQHLSIGVGVTFALYGSFNIFVGPLCGELVFQIFTYSNLHSQWIFIFHILIFVRIACFMLSQLYHNLTSNDYNAINTYK